MSSIQSDDRALSFQRAHAGAGRAASTPVLAVRDLRVHFNTYRGTVHALNGVTLAIQSGEILGLVGETGSGKSVTAYGILKLIRPPGRIVGGEVWFREQNLLNLPESRLETVRGKDIAMIFQSPRASLNPLFTIRDQMVLYIAVHLKVTRNEARVRARQMLDLVGLADPPRVLRAYPHELSTGMCQRVMIAKALSCDPALLIADEPTTGIDVTLQAQILREIIALVRRANTATLLITHDLGVVAEVCDRVAVMYAGRVVEEGPVDIVFADPRHPYTQGLIASTLRVDVSRPIHVIPGVVPNLLEPPRACPFRFRCSLAEDICGEKDPPFMAIRPAQYARCHFAENSGQYLAVKRQHAPRAAAGGLSVDGQPFSTYDETKLILSDD